MTLTATKARRRVRRGLLVACSTLILLCEFVAGSDLHYRPGAQDTCAAATIVGAGTIALALSAGRLRDFDWTVAVLNAVGLAAAVLGVMFTEIDFPARVVQLSLAAAILTLGLRNSDEGLSPITLRISGGAIALFILAFESGSSLLVP